MMENTTDSQFDQSLDSLYKKSVSLKKSIASFLTELDLRPDTIDVSKAHDHFALILSECEGFIRNIQLNKSLNLNSTVFLPLVLQQEPDHRLIELSDNRIHSFNHENVPDLLRTKLDNDLENKQNQTQDEILKKFEAGLSSQDILLFS